jgi:hypothetical protein
MLDWCLRHKVLLPRYPTKEGLNCPSPPDVPPLTAHGLHNWGVTLLNNSLVPEGTASVTWERQSCKSSAVFMPHATIWISNACSRQSTLSRCPRISRTWIASQLLSVQSCFCPFSSQLWIPNTHLHPEFNLSISLQRTQFAINTITCNKKCIAIEKKLINYSMKNYYGHWNEDLHRILIA